IEGVGDPERIKDIRKRAIFGGLKLVDCPIRHLGTEKAREIYTKIEESLEGGGVELLFKTACKDFIIEDGVCKGAKFVQKGEEFEIYADRIIVATGRKGADWLEEMCRIYNVEHKAGTVDIGVRVEVRNEIIEEINEVLYESKLIGYVPPYKDKVRTFCQNPGGFVSQENYDNKLAIVNGHSYKEKKSENTNLAILSSHNFSEPFDRPIDYAKKVGEMANMLGAGHILVQRFGDILDGKRTWQKELTRTNLKPTLPDAVAGDITAAIPYRPMQNIINFIKAMDAVVPGFAGKETLLYAPEIKFYSNKIKLTDTFMTSITNLYALGDSSGWTRGLMMASLMGVRMGNIILDETKEK
ncbi:MAG: FAD-binding protein, partial [Clostridia bacterium]